MSGDEIKEGTSKYEEILAFYDKNRPSSRPKMKTTLSETEIMKYEIAEELGFLDKVAENGWKGLTSRESGRIGGRLSGSRKRKRRE